MPQKQKFIRKEWARLRAWFDRLPQSWFLIGGIILIVIAFGASFYDILALIFGF